MKLPKKVRVGAIEYDIIFPYVFTECDDRTAQHSYTDGTILISEVCNDRTRSKQRVLSSFLHELIHAIDYNFLGGELEERQVEILGNSLYEILRYQDIKNIPKKVIVVGLEYRIHYPYQFEETNEYYSFCDNSTCDIYINENVNKYLARTSLFNQILSILSENYGIDLEIEDIKKLANGIVDTLDRNRLWTLFRK